MYPLDLEFKHNILKFKNMKSLIKWQTMARPSVPKPAFINQTADGNSQTVKVDFDPCISLYRRGYPDNTII